ncbi:hypothetical protein CALVIDRAFT_552134 [Calocera viscosa TUFC12733]|uniref:F-box domain-containing protein n=1 Tax=Calocera viscosa (strain TUFC12733) TaxID=1330018 RepID=A0A167SEM5_CALVF|nr:hypothetical protein CALVIDRAFT_552134 [Calocera viscosa TUFC12733]
MARLWKSPTTRQLYRLCSALFGGSTQMRFTDQSWNRFLFYSREIRGLSLLHDPMLPAPIACYFDHIVAHFRRQRVDAFPALRYLTCDVTGHRSLITLEGLLKEGVEKLVVSMPLTDEAGSDLDVWRPQLQQLPAMLEAKCPNLTHLEILDILQEHGKHLPLLKGLIQGTPRVKVFKMQPCLNVVSLQPDILELASSYAQLEELSLLITENYDDPVEQLSLPPPFSFPCLRSLELISVEKAPVLMALRACSLPLRRLHVEVGYSDWHKPGQQYPNIGTFNEMIKELVSAICSSPWALQIEDLKLKFAQPQGEPWVPRHPEVISLRPVRPLFQHCSRVKRFELGLQLGHWADCRSFDFQDSDLSSITEAWPGLQHLGLTWGHSHLTGSGLVNAIGLTSRLTFGGALSELAKCQQLKTVHFSFLDARTPIVTPYPAPSSSLEELTIDKGRLEQPAEKAQFLHAVWPCATLKCPTDYQDPETVWEPVQRVLEVLRKGGRVTRAMDRVTRPWSTQFAVL